VSCLLRIEYPGGDPEGNEMPDGSTVGDMGQSDSDSRGGGY